MDILVIWIDPQDPESGHKHLESHPHVLRVYSEVDEVNHSFRVTDHTLLGHVFDEFYSRSGTPHTGLDRMKCEANGEDLFPHRDLTVSHMKSTGECGELVWVFTNRPIHIKVNARDKEVHKKELTFDDVVNIRYDGHPPQGDNWEFTIDYRRGPRVNPDGHLTQGHQVWIKDGMIFDVTATDRS